jgi:hypothetical protein
MGAKNITGVRKVMRGGKPRWFLDFRYSDKNGMRQRFRRDASVQTFAAAVAEAKRHMDLAARTGSPIDESVAKVDAPTLKRFYEDTFKKLFLPRYRPATRERYVALTRQGIFDVLGDTRIDAIAVLEDRRFAASLAARGIQERGSDDPPH